MLLLLEMLRVLLSLATGALIVSERQEFTYSSRLLFMQQCNVLMSAVSLSLTICCNSWVKAASDFLIPQLFIAATYSR